jgi:hypothetical protein
MSALINDGCRDLWAAVLAQAVRDAGSTSQRAHTHSGIAPSIDEAAEARAFLLAEKGEWAESREILAEIVDLCPDYLRERVVRDAQRIRKALAGNALQCRSSPVAEWL